MRTKGTKGHTLIEMSIVMMITVIIAVGAGVGFVSFNSARERIRVEAGLDQVAAAQRSYLQTFPRRTYNELTTSMVTPFIAGNAMPADLAGWTVNVAVFPPTATRSGTTYTARNF